MRCPCRKKSESQSYETCCAPFHLGQHLAPTAEVLMRSRYSAFATLNAAYLEATWHPLTRPTDITFQPQQEWLLLRILATETDGDRATVEFEARSRIGGRSARLHEVSQFVRDQGVWLYLQGIVE